jgi:Ca2+-binding RTX toxin-like protein
LAPPSAGSGGPAGSAIIGSAVGAFIGGVAEGTVDAWQADNLGDSWRIQRSDKNYAGTDFIGVRDDGEGYTYSWRIGAGIVLSYRDLPGTGNSTCELSATGTRWDDQLSGCGARNIFRGESGHDWLKGEGGNDILSGGSGYDTLDGGIGNDLLQGGDHADLIFGGAGNDRIYGNTATESGGDDSGDNLNGDSGNDTLYGGGKDDRLWGGANHNVLIGNSGQDHFIFAHAAEHSSRANDVDFLDGDRVSNFGTVVAFTQHYANGWHQLDSITDQYGNRVVVDAAADEFVRHDAFTISAARAMTDDWLAA